MRSGYESGDDLTIDFENERSVLVAEPVRWEAEYRCFCLEGRVKACSPYLRSGELAKQTDYAASSEELSAATEFAELVLASPEAVAPKAIVLDVGQIIGQGWAVVEANAAWGSGIYGCDPGAVLDVIRHATVQPVL